MPWWHISIGGDAKMRGSYSKSYDMLESVLGSPMYANLPYM